MKHTIRARAGLNVVKILVMVRELEAKLAAESKK